MRGPTYAGIYARKNAQYNKNDIKRTLDGFLKTYSSAHSGMGLTLPIIINYCQEKGISYQLTASPNVGYAVQVICGTCRKPMKPEDDCGGDCRTCVKEAEEASGNRFDPKNILLGDIAREGKY